MENLEEREFGTSVESFQKYLDSQKELFHCQIDQLQRIVVTQCKLTGVNPLSQEMAAGAMSIKIGKRPRDLMNPKAIKYMQAVFSMKDAISKKESREISAQFGVTVTQVRDFFTSQRSRVRKLVRLSREKAARANNVYKEPEAEVPTTSASVMPMDLAPLNSVHPDPVPLHSVISTLAFSNSSGFLSSDLHSIGSTPSSLNSVGSIPAPINTSGSSPSHFNSVGSNPVHVNSVGSNPPHLNSVGSTPPHLNSVGSTPAPLNSMGADPATSSAIGTSNVEEAPSCSMQDDLLPSLCDSDQHFVENIFSLLRKEEAFSGQVKLMEWILQVQDHSVLNWFLVKGGVMILATWLSQAAAEEQTSVILVTLKVLCHLPLQKAVPEHMSAVLRSVNSLRFYRTPDISNRARVLLSRWSKMFARVQAMKKPNGIKSSTDAQDKILKQSIDEIMGNELWQSSVSNPGDALIISEGSENNRKTEPSQTLKLLPASADDSSRKHILGVSSSHIRERRKVQLVEQPGQKTAGRSPLANKVAPANRSRPMSADDIQKAKMRAFFMQSKYGKNASSSNGLSGTKTGLCKPSNTSSNFSSVTKVPMVPKTEENKQPAIVKTDENKQPAIVKTDDNRQPSIVKTEEDRQPAIVKTEENRQPAIVKTEENTQPALVKIEVKKQPGTVNIEESKQTAIAAQKFSDKHEGPLDQRPKLDLKELLEELRKRVQISWRMPPEIRLDDSWRVGTGECSKEVDVQRNRNRREAETIYRTIQTIPSNPKEPWDLEMDYDDTLTPDVPVEQQPDAEVAEAQVPVNDRISTAVVTTTPPLPQTTGGNATEPDLELLAVLLKNPELVFALTSGQARDISSEDTVKLLDMIKRSGNALADSVNGYSRKPEEKIEVSLPSPTPSSNPGTAGWRTEVAKNPFSQQGLRGKRVVHDNSAASAAIQAAAKPVAQLLSQQVQSPISSFPLLQATSSSIIHENRQPSMILPSHRNLPTNSFTLQTQSPEMGLPSKTSCINPSPSQNFIITTGSSLRVETVNPVKQAQSVTYAMNTPDRRPVAFSTATPARSQIPEPVHHPSRPSVDSMPESWRSRRSVASNSLSQVNQINYDAPSFRGHAQPQVRSGPPLGGNELVGNDGFESWSPENSPSRSPEYIPGRNDMGPGTNAGWNYSPDNRARQRNYNNPAPRDQSRINENRRWR